MALIETLQTNLKLDSTQFKQEMNGAELYGKNSLYNLIEPAKAAGAAIAASLGVVAVGAVYEFTKAISESTEHVMELSHSAERLGIGLQAFQELQFAANESGVSADELNKALKFMEKNLGNIEAGLADSKLSDYFKALNLNISELTQLAPDEAFNRIVKAINAIPDPLERVAARVALFSKSGNIVGSMADNVDNLKQKFNDLGLALSDEQVASVTKYGQSVKEVGSIWESFKNQLIASIVPELTKLINTVEEWIEKTGGMQVVAGKVKDALLSFVHEVSQAFTGFNYVLDNIALGFLKFSQVVLESTKYLTLGISSTVNTALDNATNAYNQRLLSFSKYINTTASKSPITEPTASTSTITKKTVESESLTNGFTELANEKAITEEQKKQLELLKQAVKTQQEKISAYSKEQEMIKELVAGTGGENDRLKQAEDTVNKLHKEFENMLGDNSGRPGDIVDQKPSFLDNADPWKVQQLEAAFQKFQDYEQSLKESSQFQQSFPNNRLDDMLKVLQYFNNPANQFGAGNTPREQKVQLQIAVSAEEGFAAKVATSNENKDVITNIVNQQISDATRGEYR